MSPQATTTSLLGGRYVIHESEEVMLPDQRITSNWVV